MRLQECVELLDRGENVGSNLNCTFTKTKVDYSRKHHNVIYVPVPPLSCKDPPKSRLCEESTIESRE